MNLNELRDEAYNCSVAHGFHEKEHSNEHWLCLVISELMEAVEADRIGRHADIEKFNQEMDYCLHEMKLHGEKYDEAYRDKFEYYLKNSFEDELADACIRLLDLAGLRCIDFTSTEYAYQNVINQCKKREEEHLFTELAFPLCKELTSGDDLEILIGAVLLSILIYCHCYNIDIMWHIEQKIKYNVTRPYRHGKNY